MIVLKDLFVKTMKRLVLILVLMACCLGAAAQNRQGTPDSAEMIVRRYFKTLNYDAIRTDNILYMETIIYKRSAPTDTAVLKRWFLPPNRFRAELWHGDTLLEGCYSDGKEVFRESNLKMFNGWVKVANSRYYDLAHDYDFRGALYYRVADACELKYEGVWDFNGNEVYRVFVDTPLKYCRNYLFEKESGLLFLIQETNQHSEYSNHKAYDHPDWHAYHEYQPLDDVLLPSVESYQMDGDILFHYTSYRYIPLDLKVFTED